MLGLVAAVASVIGWFAGPGAAVAFVFFGVLAVLFSWWVGVAGEATQSWARSLYGDDRDDGGYGYSDMVGRYVRQERVRRDRGRR